MTLRIERPTNPCELTTFDGIAWLVAVSLAVLHALLFGSWIVDDAGISFAYARSLAGGHGLVAQPGSVPVEGYSNPLWVFMMAPFFALGAFHPVLTPKIVGLVLVSLTFAVVYVTVRVLSGRHRRVAFLALLSLALNTSFVAWSVSGLENSLYALLVYSLLALAVVPITPPRGEPVGYALLALLVALARPDGVAYACLYPIVVVARASAVGDRGRRVAQNVAIYVGVFGAIAVTLLGLRIWYFHDLLPNTYYAKGGPELRGLLVAGRIDSLIDAAVGSGGGLWLLWASVATLFFARTGRMGWRHVVSLLFLCEATVLFLLLPPDWLGEFRLGSPFFPFFFGHILVTIWFALEAICRSRRWRDTAWMGLGIAAIAASVVLEGKRSLHFASSPPIPFAEIEKRTRRFDRYAMQLGVEEGSMLTPDLGAALYFSRLKIFDLGMLCDRTISRTLGKDPASFYDYVLEEAKPTFIHTHDLFTALARFEDDPRFRRDYVPIREWTGDAWIFEPYGVRMLHSGEYVRREAIGNRVLR